jgi:hypothetical protein
MTDAAVEDIVKAIEERTSKGLYAALSPEWAAIFIGSWRELRKALEAARVSVETDMLQQIARLTDACDAFMASNQALTDEVLELRKKLASVEAVVARFERDALRARP